MTGAVAGLVLSLGMIAPSVTAVAAAGYDFNSAASLQVVVNKHRQLSPAAYVPGQLVRVQGERLRAQAADAYKQFAKAAKVAGVNVMPISGYRSFSEQASLYDSYVRQYGQATADTLAARPGYSEHQTGLAMDIGNASGICALQACFANTPAGQWAAAHGWEYGFIIRYPAGAQATTGYTYEPWHLRYVGRPIAEDMKSTGITTLEKYFGLEAAPDYLQ
ncbi:M15 family metallopeptidase [Arthrobacter sp. ES3-54]|jgi:zinc D-Ala-D-Ala carboxypeptidase|uniref:M15 family metallopeptidase n=1 Tax=Arthrobacter sp. ES3-54 TaxID=1502991 RepID=UPI0024062CAC|nr:M15 family metallopeptidase [Arthrobacter sp. ES3-54]MDF9749989.1 D-alanyl-D-alanine carboxypeptidase [Arthrobacter sp. ES3-54]